MHTTMCFLGMAFWFPILFYLGRVRWETAPNKLRDEENKTVLCLQNRNRSVLGWALLLPETGIAVPATLVSGLGCFPRGRPRQGNAKTRVDERSTCDFAFYLAFGRAGLCCGRNPGSGIAVPATLVSFPALVAFHVAAAPGKRKNACR